MERRIKEERKDSVSWYLCTYGDSINARLNSVLGDAAALADADYLSASLVTAVTVSEIIVRHSIPRPLLEGALLSEEWSQILAKRIFSQSANSDREILPVILRTIGIEIDRLQLSDARPLWKTFISECISLRNAVVHAGAKTALHQSLAANRVPKDLLVGVVVPLAKHFGLSWPESAGWHRITQGIGGATFSTICEPKDVLEAESRRVNDRGHR